MLRSAIGAPIGSYAPRGDLVYAQLDPAVHDLLIFDETGLVAPYFGAGGRNLAIHQGTAPGLYIAHLNASRDGIDDLVEGTPAELSAYVQQRLSAPTSIRVGNVYGQPDLDLRTFVGPIAPPGYVDPTSVMPGPIPIVMPGGGPLMFYDPFGAAPPTPAAPTAPSAAPPGAQGTLGWFALAAAAAFAFGGRR